MVPTTQLFIPVFAASFGDAILNFFCSSRLVALGELALDKKVAFKEWENEDERARESWQQSWCHEQFKIGFTFAKRQLWELALQGSLLKIDKKTENIHLILQSWVDTGFHTQGTANCR